MASPDLSEFFKLSRPKSKPCPVAFAITQLSADEQAQLEAALGHDVGIITNAAIRDWFKARGHVLTDAAVGVHRRGTCACGRNA